jgi:hypothetical protein
MLATAVVPVRKERSKQRQFVFHTAHSWFVTALAEIMSEIRGALVVGVEVLTDPTM